MTNCDTVWKAGIRVFPFLTDAGSKPAPDFRTFYDFIEIQSFEISIPEMIS